jgi:hypothetical protein
MCSEFCFQSLLFRNTEVLTDWLHEYAASSLIESNVVRLSALPCFDVSKYVFSSYNRHRYRICLEDRFVECPRLDNVSELTCLGEVFLHVHFDSKVVAHEQFK